jgi:hypothetical protein
MAAQQAAGAVQWRRGRSRCADRSVGGCADWHAFSDHLCASLWWSGRRGGSASAACAVAEPWTTVEWAVWPARPNDPAALGRGRSSAEPTAHWSGMAERISPGSKACERVAPGHRTTEARGMPGGGTRAARGGEPAGAPTPRGGGCPPASNPVSAPVVGGERPLPRVAGPVCSLVCLRIPRQGRAPRDPGRPASGRSPCGGAEG